MSMRVPFVGLLVAIAVAIWISGCSSLPASPSGRETGTTSVSVTPSLTITSTIQEPSPTLTPVTGKVFVDVRTEVGKISPLVYGTNVGPWQNITRSMRPFLTKAGFALFRFPGGNWGDEYLLTHQQLDKFVAFCQEEHAVPLVQVNLFQGSPEEAAELVRYANVVRGYGIQYWNIGNEPDLYAVTRGEVDYTTSKFNADWKRFAAAMRAVDPSIKFVGPEISAYTGTEHDRRDRDGKLWMPEFLKANGKQVDVVSFHWYPFGKPGADRDSLLAQPAEWGGVIQRLRVATRRYVGRDLPIAVTEANSDWTGAEGGEATPDSFNNALWWADVLGRLMRQRVFMVGQFALSGARGLGLLSLDGPRPTYYVYLLYRHFGDTMVYASSPYRMTPVYASTGEGFVSLMVVNKQPHDVQLPLEVAGAKLARKGEYWRLDAHGWSQGVLEGSTLSLPAFSATVFRWRIAQK